MKNTDLVYNVRLQVETRLIVIHIAQTVNTSSTGTSEHNKRFGERCNVYNIYGKVMGFRFE